MQEGRVADHGDHALVLVGFATALVHAQGDAHRGAHRDAGVHSLPGVAGAQRVAADIPGNVEVADLRQRVIDAEVGASDAHGWRPREDLHRHDRAQYWHRFAEQFGNGGLQHVGGQFALQRQDFLADDRDALGFEFGFDQRLDFLDDNDLLDHAGQLAAFFERYRPRKAELEDWRVREGFLDVHVGRA